MKYVSTSAVYSVSRSVIYSGVALSVSYNQTIQLGAANSVVAAVPTRKVNGESGT